LLSRQKRGLTYCIPYLAKPTELHHIVNWSTKQKGKLGFPFFWSGRRGSNSRPQPWQGCALPTELLPHLADFFCQFTAFDLHQASLFSAFTRQKRDYGEGQL
jgi:hypothetical protein